MANIKSIGVLGFNVIELCGMARWGREKFPNCEVHRISNVVEARTLDGVVVRGDFYLANAKYFSVELNLLIIFEPSHSGYDELIKVNLPNVKSTIAASEIESKVSNWLNALSSGEVSRQQFRKSKRLTAREIQIISLIKDGATNDDIATSLGIRKTTVKSYLRRIFRRLGASNRAHAVSLYTEIEHL